MSYSVVLSVNIENDFKLKIKKARIFKGYMRAKVGRLAAYVEFLNPIPALRCVFIADNLDLNVIRRFEI